MAIERRVKPSSRASEELARRRKPILIGCGVLALVLVLGFAGFQLLQRFNDARGSTDDPATVLGGQDDISGGLTSSSSAERALLAGSASYEGSWANDTAGRYSLYLPGTVQVSGEEVVSDYLAVNEGNTAAYGVLVADQPFPTLDNDPTLDTSTMLSVFIQDLAKDVGAAMYGATFSGAYDMSAYELSDGSRVIWVTGDMQTIVSKRLEDGTELPAEEMYFPLCGFIAMVEDIPMFVWGVANPEDASVSTTLSSTMQECAGVFASAKKLTIPSFDEFPTVDTPTDGIE